MMKPCPNGDLTARTAWHATKAPYAERDHVFDLLVLSQFDPPVEVYAATYESDFYGHQRTAALTSLGDESPCVLIHAFHDEDLQRKDGAERRSVSPRLMLKRSRCVPVNSVEQGRAIVKALVSVFGDAVLRGIEGVEAQFSD